MPNWRDPITKTMILRWANLAQKAHQDSFAAALYNWMVLGHYAGFQKTEWMQDNVDFKRSHDFARNIDGSVKAFTMSDFEFWGKNNCHLINAHTRRITTVAQVMIC